jgi:ribose transport system substrate-binding protein
MPSDRNKRTPGVSRRTAVGRIIAVSAGLIGSTYERRLKGWGLFGAAVAQPMPTIPIIAKGAGSPYWQAVFAGARKAGRDLGVNVVEFGAQLQNDGNGQIEIPEGALASNPAVIVAAPAHFAALGKSLDQAAKNAKVIGIDATMDSRTFTSVVTTNSLQAGQVAADILAERIQKTYADPEGDVALIAPSVGVASIDARNNGFKEQLKKRYGALYLTSEKLMGDSVSASNDIMANLIAKHDELRGVFTSTLVATQGAAQVVAKTRNNRSGDILNLVGFDWDPQLVELLRNGVLAALVVQDPFRIGYDSIKTALAVSKGQTVPAKVEIDATVITKANLSSARSQELLSSKVN